MLFQYKALDTKENEKSGTIDAVTKEVAISSLQRRGLVILSIELADKKSIFDITLFESVSSREMVILSRQISTLFEAQVSALRVFRLLGAESENPFLGRKLLEIADDLQGGASIGNALSRHPKIFSPFYINMVRSGEEAGRLDETFTHLADHLDRTYEIVSKARNALVYPAFVVFVFVTVMILMLTLVIPNISEVLIDAGQDIPIYTKIVIGLSDFFLDYGIFLLALLIIGGFFLWRYSRTEQGRLALSEMKVAIPFVGSLYRKLYLSRISDSLSTLLASGITMVRAIEIASSVVDNALYEKLLNDTANQVKAGSSVSSALGEHPEIPGIMVQMIKVGEETGEVGSILKTLTTFYRREVTGAVDALVNLIEPIMVVVLAVGVGILLASVLIPIYNLSSAI